MTRNNCYTLFSHYFDGNFSQRHDQPVTIIYSFEEYEPGNPQPVSVYRNQDADTLSKPYENAIPGQKPFDGQIHLTEAPANFPPAERLFAGILQGTKVVNVTYDNNPKPFCPSSICQTVRAAKSQPARPATQSGLANHLPLLPRPIPAHRPRFFITRNTDPACPYQQANPRAVLSPKFTPAQLLTPSICRRSSPQTPLLFPPPNPALPCRPVFPDPQYPYTTFPGKSLA